MISYKLLIVQILLIGTAICLPQSRTNTPDTDLSTTDNVQETSTDLAIRSTESSHEYIKDKVVLTVYYETHCRFSVDFFLKQLVPAVLKLGSHLELNTVPYGLAETHDDNGVYTFSCQHGARECHGNTVHACVLNHVKNKTQAVLYNSRLMYSTNDYTNTVIALCGLAEKVPALTISNILKCVKGTEGSFLLKSYGEVTKLNRVHYVPHLTFDGSSVLEEDGRANLIDTICGLISPRPTYCPPPIEKTDTSDYFDIFSMTK